MRPFDQVTYPLGPLDGRRASRDPLAMIGASRVVATGSLHHRRSVIVRHGESGGMDVLISDIGSNRSVSVSSEPGETRAMLIARAHAIFDQKCAENAP